jgi:predicted ATPase/DNA-binding CsgD family transcriptional regulator
VTFLLTEIDLAGVEATSGAVARHDEVLDEVIVSYGGRRLVERGEGDSVAVMFGTATAAVSAGLDAQRGLAPVGVRLRTAIHTGEAELGGDGNDVGSTITRCRGLLAIGHVGQVLVTDNTRRVVGVHLPEGAYFRDLGGHRLRDLGGAERVWQLCHGDLDGDFPPLRSLDAFEHNLPTLLTRLIGREGDTAAVRAAMRDGRLVTLVGAGGVGKTRLGLQVAAELVGEFDGGVWWVELAAVSDPNSLPGAVLDAIGLVAQPGRRPVRVLADYVGDRPTLIVLDNCEHVIAASASFVDELLSSLPGVAVLATSREPLSVPGETVWRVPSLGVPDPSLPPTVDSIGNADATRLFIDRARRARPDLVLSDAAAGAVARICVRLDGIPLSIELAAARCRNLAVEQVARELDVRFRLLTGGARTVVERQRTLKASIDWSHDLLDDAERVALRRLGVLAGPFTVSAAEAVVAAFGDIARDDVLDLVDHLADKSLVAPDGVDPAGESRYRLLETIRTYALDRLDDAGELVAARDAHAAFWAGWAEEHNVHFDCSLTILDAIPANLANLTAAARWACVSRPELLQPLMLCIGPFVQLEDRERASEGLFESALAALEGRDEIAWAHVAMAVESARAFTWVVVADEQLRVRAAALAAEHDLVLIRAHLAFTSAAITTKDPEGFAVASELFDEAGSPTWGPLMRALGVRYLAATGRLAAAEELLAAQRHSTNDLTLATIVGGETQVALVRGELVGRARRARDELADLTLPNSSRMSVLTSLLAYDGVARVAFFSGERDVLVWAAASLGEGARSTVERRLAAVAAAHLSVFDEVSPNSSARTAVESTLRERLVGSATGGGLLRRETPYLAIAAGDPDWIASERAVIERYAAENDQRVRCFMSLADGVLALFRGDDTAAQRHWHDLLAVSSEHGFGLLWVDALEGLGICAARAGATDEAARLVGAAESARNHRGYQYRYPHLAELPPGSDEGRTLSLEEATAYARRSRGERTRPVSGWAALTPTEAEVARAVADGLTNKQAAEQLFISVPTVKTHLRHIFAKLGIDNRSQLAAEVSLHNR